AELGAHVVKTYYCENFEKVVEGTPLPIIIAGGKKLSKEADVLELAYNAIRKGASGVDMGRNIWQSDCPVAMIKALRAIVHKDSDVNEAYSILLKERNKESQQHQKILKPVTNTGSV